jgi:hypothetical protein
VIVTVPHDETLYPTLGPQVCDFIEQNLVFGPGDLRGQPAVLDDEKLALIYRMYEVHPQGHALAGRRRFKRCGLSLVKGLAKTELAAWIAACELHPEAPVRCVGWTKDGEPIGGPVTDPYIALVAYTEEQSDELAYTALKVILEEGPLKDDFDIGLDRILRKKGGGIAQALSGSPNARDGARTTFQHFDEALALDTPIPTPSGWSTMGDLLVGQAIFGLDGSPCLVIGKSAVHVGRPCYRVTFADGTSVVTDEGHLWHAHRRGGCGHGQGCRCELVQGWAVRKTSEMTDVTFSAGRRPAFRYHVPYAAPLDLPVAALPLDPYLLGVWLGDGDERNAVISGAEADLAVVEAEMQAAGYSTSRCSTQGRASGLMYVTTTDSRPGRYGDSVVGRLRKLGVLKRKHIPVSYLRGSFDQRLALLQGLLDSDGHITDGGYCTFVNTSPELVDGALELLRTLGYAPRVSWRVDPRKASYLRVAKVSFQARPEVPPFRLPRKAARITSRAAMAHAIVSVEAVDSVPVQCIAVDAPDRLFLAGDGFIPTHNTHRFTAARLKAAHQTMLANIPKRKMADAWTLETTTAFEPGTGSVAESTMEYARAVADGLVEDASLFFFHRSASDDHDFATEQGFRDAVVEASGLSAAWRDIDSIVGLWKDPTADRAYLERVYCNRLVKGSTQAFDVVQWKTLAIPDRRVQPGAQIVLGFDGAMFHDASGLVATDIETGFQWVPGAWECPPNANKGPGSPEWQVPTDEVDAAVHRLFTEYRVWRMYADPPYWQSWLAKWAGEFGAEQVIAWWTNRRKAMTYALNNYTTAIWEGTISHDGDKRLTKHLANARRKDLPGERDEQGKSLWLIQKDRPDSPNKIDCAMASVLSWQARTDAIAAGAGHQPEYQMMFVGGR